MKPKILLAYPNLPLMMAPPMSMAIFTAIALEMQCEVELFETAQYSDECCNRHIRMAEVGAVRSTRQYETKDAFYIKPTTDIIPDWLSCVESYQPDLIIMSVQEDVWRIARDMMNAISHLNIPHVLGGLFPTTAPELVLQESAVKCICRQEGENPIRQVIQLLKQHKDIHTAHGLWWKDRFGLLHKNAPQALCDINDITPDYRLFSPGRMKRFMGGRVFERALNIETYRGCPYNCTYCNSPGMRDHSRITGAGNYMRRKCAARVEQDLLHYLETHQIDFVNFVDDSFLARPKKEIFEFCEMWSRYKIPYWCNTRIENCTPDVMDALRESGVYRISFGLESGNETYRADILHRKVSNETYLRHFEIINDSNIPYSLNVIIGMPFETRDMVLESAALCRAASGYDGLTVSLYQPYHGCVLRQTAVDNGFLDPNHVNGMNPNNIGGYLDHWPLRMPEPYLQPQDADQLLRTFVLYAHFPQHRWPEIRAAENDQLIYQTLLTKYQQERFGDVQQGGRDRIRSQGSCAKHDASADYLFQLV